MPPLRRPHGALAVQGHEAILNALRRRDGVALAHIMRTHLRRKRNEVLQAGFADSEHRATGTADEERAAVRSG
jgi:DNA-binding GntR family transcriptional regulator